jgi:hypothetical protein
MMRLKLLRMISFSLLILYSLNCVYLLWWVHKAYNANRWCADKKFPPGEPGPIKMSIWVLFASVLNLVGWTYWGITDNPWHPPNSKWVIHAAQGGLELFVAIFFLGSLGYIFYMFGKISAVTEPRTEVIRDRQYQEREEEVRRQFYGPHAGAG